MTIFHFFSAKKHTEGCSYMKIDVYNDIWLKFYVYNGNIQFLDLFCLNFNCPLLLCFTIFWAEFFNNMSKKINSTALAKKFDKNAKFTLSIFNGCRKKSDFFTKCNVYGLHRITLKLLKTRNLNFHLEIDNKGQ